jgi:hypothetical protein
MDSPARCEPRVCSSEHLEPQSDSDTILRVTNSTLSSTCAPEGERDPHACPRACAVDGVLCLCAGMPLTLWVYVLRVQVGVATAVL